MSHFPPSAAHPFMKAISLSSLSLLCFGLGACSGEAEVFTQTAAVLSERVGEQCTIEPLPFGNQVVVEESDACGDGVCLGVEEQTYCSCPCSGPESEAPFCSCPVGFYCQDELVTNLGINRHVGGYCVWDG